MSKDIKKTLYELNELLGVENYTKTSNNIQYLSPEWFREKGKEYIPFYEKVKDAYTSFSEKYSIEKIKQLSGEDILNKFCYGKTDNNLCYELEHKLKDFGTINGYPSKYGLYFKKNDEWHSTKDKISESKAIELGTEIRNNLVLGAEIIKNYGEIKSLQDYNKIYSLLDEKGIASNDNNWVLKYYHMLFPDIFPPFYSNEWHIHILLTLGINPVEKDISILRMGQIKEFIDKCSIPSIIFAKIFSDYIGKPKAFYGIKIDNNNFDNWKEKQYIAIDLNEFNNLDDIFSGEENKDDIISNLIDTGKYSKKIATSKYNEIKMFYTTKIEKDNNYIVAINEEQILSIGLLNGDYYFDDENSTSNKYAHCRSVNWLKFYDKNQFLENKDDGKLNSFFKITKLENIRCLYNLLKPINTNNDINFYTGYKCAFDRNRIIFGAPGTGKSFTLNEEKAKLLGIYNDTNYERVTFHPDYSYANFVGTYKPVPKSGDKISYEYVPGPFMRLFVKAINNAKTNDIQPFVLIIEEINRSNVASVFGDIFQLLDRDDNNISEYPIQISEDVKKYLKNETGKDFKEIKIPDNMFIWATMNSADQGVFPMDTAFKRRWSFKYIGIDDSENNIENKNVKLGTGNYEKDISWNALRKAINNKLSSMNINEDKLLGPHFISKKIVPIEGNIEKDKFIEAFKNKVLMYLFTDVLKHKKGFFSDKIETGDFRYSTICKAFDEQGIYIFCKDIVDKF